MAAQQLTGTTPIDPAALRQLRARFRGPLIQPGDDGYDAARAVWNGMIDRRPALIARCTGVADVMEAVRFARERELLVAVRGGGHNVAGTAVCDGGLVIDLSPMKGIRVDPVGRRAWAQPGVLWGELDRETQAFQLATTGGIVTHTGIAGLTLGGGLGWLMRKHGLTVDNLAAAEVVTAEGELLRASAEERADLFWGLRGGGGNFGIVTGFEYRLHPLGPLVLAGPVFYPLERADAVLRAYRDAVRDAPDDLATIVVLRRAPRAPFLPDWLHGRPVVMVAVCYAGPLATGEDVVRPLRSLGDPLLDLVGPKPYTAHQSMFDVSVPHGWCYYWKSWDLEELSDAAIGILVEGTRALTSPLSYTIIFQLGGAVSRVPEAAMAYSHRHLNFSVNINAVWQAGDPAPERHIQWARDLYAALEPLAPGGVYVNFLGDEGAARVRAAYGPEKYARLAALKARYDPTNFFRLNQNIPPRRPSG